MNSLEWKIITYMYDCWQCGQKSVTYANIAEILDTNYEALCIIIPSMIKDGLVKKEQESYLYSLTLKSMWLMWQNRVLMKGF
jgi:hypothetical protein